MHVNAVHGSLLWCFASLNCLEGTLPKFQSYDSVSTSIPPLRQGVPARHNFTTSGLSSPAGLSVKRSWPPLPHNYLHCKAIELFQFHTLLTQTELQDTPGVWFVNVRYEYRFISCFSFHAVVVGSWLGNTVCSVFVLENSSALVIFWKRCLDKQKGNRNICIMNTIPYTAFGTLGQRRIRLNVWPKRVYHHCPS